VEFRASAAGSTSNQHSGHYRGRFIDNSRTNCRVSPSFGRDSGISSNSFLGIRGFLFGLEMRIIDPTLLVRVAVVSAKDVLASVAVELVSIASIIAITRVRTLSI
jgi:hypothetical protein